MLAKTERWADSEEALRATRPAEDGEDLVEDEDGRLVTLGERGSPRDSGLVQMQTVLHIRARDEGGVSSPFRSAPLEELFFFFFLSTAG